MNKIKASLLATDLAPWRKKGIFFATLLLSLFPFVISYQAALPEWQQGLWQLRHFLAIAALQALAQVSIGWYLLKKPLPNYVIGGFLVMLLSFQLTYGITVVLLSVMEQARAAP
ncbi:hypothetical protein [Shewanella khirikhana]|uniref:Uncharacterized protein n=1 Tax=Shewanella khirikhana TaxID=1965282 RepID=A0ABM7DQJ8_9GAMM|nr:hypothetical protein [Shewanella khirikhana]AZQ11966.1 hypothetical protein STH12_02897 [Shewanella khirikhana]